MNMRGSLLVLKTFVEQGLRFLQAATREVIQLLGLPLLWANCRLEIMKQDVCPSLSIGSQIDCARKFDFSVPDKVDMLVDDIKTSSNWACWHVIFGDSSERREMCKPLAIIWGKHLNLQNETLSDSDEIELIFDDDDCGSNTHSMDSFDNSENDFEILFDDDCEIIYQEESNNDCLPDYFHSSSSSLLFQELDSGFDEFQGILSEKILPCVTKECISLKAKDILSCAGQDVTIDSGKERVTKECHIKPCLPTQWSAVEIRHFSNQVENKQSKKTVSFANEEELFTVHPMVCWNFAYRKARKGHWERYACDRAHFKRRIASYRDILDPVLERKYQQYLNNKCK